MKPKDAQKLAAIARATFALVERGGLRSLTMAGIARQAGLATATLYVYFASKEELLAAVYQQAKTEAAARMFEGDDPRKPLRARFARLWRNWVENRLAQGAQMLFMEQYANSPWYDEASRSLSTRLFAAWGELVAQAQAQQVIKNLPPPLVMGAFAGSVRETANLLRAGTLPHDRKTLDQAFALCWDGIKA